MLIRTTYEAALRFLGDAHLLWDETVVPHDIPLLSHHPYVSEYGWLFSLERRLARLVEPWLQSYRHDLIGSKGVLNEALSNAYCHAHKRDAGLSMQITIHRSSKGILIRIKDQGKGFDVESTIRRCQSGRDYYKIAGNGLRLMMESRSFQIFFDERGTACHLLHLFLPADREAIE